MDFSKRIPMVHRNVDGLTAALAALLVLSVHSVPVAAMQEPSASLAQDSRSLADESATTRAMFMATWGDQAPARWIDEHNRALAGAGTPSGPHIGVLYQGPSSAAPIRQFLAAFIRGLRDEGFSPGKDLLIDWRFAEGRLEHLPGLADELVTRRPDVIVVLLSQEAVIAHAATSSIPIVTVNVPDPVGDRLVSSLEQPGGNVTGMAGFTPQSAAALQVLKQAMPAAMRVAVLVSNATGGPTPSSVDELRAAAAPLGLELFIHELRNMDDLRSAFAAAQAEQADALIWPPGSGDGAVYTPNIARIVELANTTGRPMMHLTRHAVDMGGLMSYGPNYAETYRRAAAYVAHILNGARPQDLPMERNSSVEFVVNLKAAQAIRLTIPDSVLSRATEIIR